MLACLWRSRATAPGLAYTGPTASVSVGQLFRRWPIAPTRNMLRSKEFGHSLRFFQLYAPNAVPTIRLAEQVQSQAVPLKLLLDFARYQIGLGDEHLKWLHGLLPTI